MAVVNGPDSCLEPPFLSLLRSRWTYFAKLDDLLLPSSGRSGAGDDMIVGLILCRGDGGLFFWSIDEIADTERSALLARPDKKEL